MAELMDEKKASGSNKTVVIAVVLFVILAAILLIVSIYIARKDRLPDAVTVTGGISAQTTGENVPAVQKASDLNTAAAALDATDLDALDSELNQLDADTSAF